MERDEWGHVEREREMSGDMWRERGEWGHVERER